MATYLTKAFEELKTSKILYGTIGDYFMTGTSINSRNFRYGMAIASNRNMAQKFLETKILYNYLKNNNYNLMIINLLYSIIIENKNENLLREYLK